MHVDGSESASLSHLLQIISLFAISIDVVCFLVVICTGKFSLHGGGGEDV